MMTRTIVTLSLVLLAACPAPAGQTVREFHWADLEAVGGRSAGEVLPADARSPAEQLKVANPGGAPQTVHVLDVADPGVTAKTYAIEGYVRTEGVEGRAYLEMWSHFPGSDRFYSRALQDSGPLGRLEGTQDRRRFVLLFYNKADAAPPERLTVSLVLPGSATVYLDSVRLVEYAPGEDPLAVPGAWWADSTGGLLGGLGGTLLGLLGAAVGVLAGKGRARGLTIGLMGGAAFVGGALFAGGTAALLLGQPYGVWYPLMLLGGVAGLLFACLLPTVRRRYAALELRRMAAADAS